MRYISVVGLVLLASGIGSCDKRGEKLLDAYVDALKSAKTLSYAETLKARNRAGEYDTYSAKVTLAKPGMFRIEAGSGELLVCDGKKIYEYSPAKKVCLVSEAPESIDSVRGHFGSLPYFTPWIFFDPNPKEQLTSRVQDQLAERSDPIDGEPCTTLVLDYGRDTSQGLTLSDGDHMVRRYRYRGPWDEKVVTYREGQRSEVGVDRPMQVSAFAFVPKEGVRMIDLPKLEGRMLAVGEKAPDFVAKTPEGKTIQLSKLRGKVVLIDFWASWCGPCLRALPETNKIAEEYGGEDFAAIGLNVWEEQEPMDEFVAEHDYSLTFAREPGPRDEGMAAILYQVQGIPTMYIIDQEGKIAKGFVGLNPETGPKEIREVLGKLGVKPKH